MRVLVLALCLTLLAVPTASAGPLAPACAFTSTFGGVVGATVDYTSAQCGEADGIVFGGGSVVGLVDNTLCYAVGQHC